MVYGHGYFEHRGYSVKQLAIEVSDLHVGDDNRIKLTCMATIPGYGANLETPYADIRESIAESKYKLN